MDCSNEYVDMCRKATEIQNKHEWKDGDFVADSFVGFHCFNYSIGIHCDECKREYGKWSANATWLPRQDQLQAMIDFSKEMEFSGLYELTTFLRFYGFEKNWSMEQLWLAFVQNQLHQLKWDGKEWKNHE